MTANVQVEFLFCFVSLCFIFTACFVGGRRKRSWGINIYGQKAKKSVDSAQGLYNRRHGGVWLRG